MYGSLDEHEPVVRRGPAGGGYGGRRWKRAIVPAIALVVIAIAAIDAMVRQRDNEDLRVSRVMALHGQTMGTTWTITLAGNPDHDADTDAKPALPPGVTLDDVRDQIQTRLDEIDGAMSTWINSSEVSAFNAYTGDDWFDVSNDTATVVAEALRVSEATDGAFDVTVAPLVDLWGFGPGGRPAATPDAKPKPPSDDAIEAARANVGYRRLHVRLDPPALKKDAPGVRIDLSGLAKGYAVDQVAAVLDEIGIPSFLIDIGGEMRASGRGPHLGGAPSQNGWIVGVLTPILSVETQAESSIDDLMTLSDNAAATSGDYFSFVEFGDGRRAHIIDPRTGRPAVGAAASATVIDTSCMTADAWATALLAIDADAAHDLAERQNVAAMLIVHTADGGLAHTNTTAWAP
ncbi:MAG: FAD:protein FMN transferase ApbE [Phycisphaera sp.]|nr:FAD:protein FMN transferase ApbE [Phycisphaera sp.]